MDEANDSEGGLDVDANHDAATTHDIRYHIPEQDGNHPLAEVRVIGSVIYNET